MKNPFLIGNRLYLRPLEASDVGETYLSWLNDPEVTRYMETGRFPTTERQLREYVMACDGMNKIAFAIVLKKNDMHIGTVTLNNIHFLKRMADTGIMIGQKDCWGKGYAFEAWSLIIEYAFLRLGLRKIIAGAAAEHHGSAKTLRKLGFKEEGVLRKEVMVDGEFQDGIRFGLFRDEFCAYTSVEQK